MTQGTMLGVCPTPTPQGRLQKPLNDRTLLMDLHTDPKKDPHARREWQGDKIHQAGRWAVL